MKLVRKAGSIALAVSLVLIMGACGDDNSTNSASDDSDAGEPNGFTVSVTEEGISMPDEVVGGIVEVSLETDLKKKPAPASPR